MDASRLVRPISAGRQGRFVVLTVIEAPLDPLDGYAVLINVDTREIVTHYKAAEIIECSD